MVAAGRIPGLHKYCPAARWPSFDEPEKDRWTVLVSLAAGFKQFWQRQQ